MSVLVSSFYHFQRLDRTQVRDIEAALKPFKQRQMRGLILLGTEGINATVSGPKEVLNDFKSAVSGFFSGVIHFKDSVAEKYPFREFKIRMRKEIVTLGRPDLAPETGRGHLSPEEWHAALSDPAAVVLDTRNRYEVEIGKFQGAVDLGIDEFREFPERVRAMNLPKEQKILMYCTGGIRCEKAILEMRDQGYENVCQLRGGILEYLKEFPEQKFEGECFVFDYRVAVDQKLQPSRRFSALPPLRPAWKAKNLLHSLRARNHRLLKLPAGFAVLRDLLEKLRSS